MCHQTLTTFPNAGSHSKYKNISIQVLPKSNFLSIDTKNVQPNAESNHYTEPGIHNRLADLKHCFPGILSTIHITVS